MHGRGPRYTLDEIVAEQPAVYENTEFKAIDPASVAHHTTASRTVRLSNPMYTTLQRMGPCLSICASPAPAFDAGLLLALYDSGERRISTLLGVKRNTVTPIDGYNLRCVRSQDTGYSVFVKFVDGAKRKLMLSDVLEPVVSSEHGMCMKLTLGAVKRAGFLAAPDVSHSPIFCVVFADRIAGM